MTALRWTQISLLALLGFVAYAPTLRVGFIYDDHILIESNPYIRTWSASTVKHDFTAGVFNDSNSVGFYRPLQTFTTRIEYSICKLNPLLYHLSNILLHIGNILLLAELLILLGVGNLPVMLASCLFAVHPIIVEPMLMVSGRGELLGMFFSLSSLVLMLNQRLAAITLGLVAYLLALFSKESAVVTPLLLTLLILYRKRSVSQYWLLLPMGIITGAYFELRMHALGRLLPAIGAILALKFCYMELPKVLFTYARILIIPLDLHTDRLLPPHGLHWYLYTVSVIGISTWILCRGVRWAKFCLFWFIVTIMPKTILMISGSFMSDHWAYPALPAIVLPIALWLSRGWKSPIRKQQIYLRGIFTILVLCELSLVYFNIAHRDTDEKLYRSALQYPTTLTMKYNLGMELLRQGRNQEALPYIDAVYLQDPENIALGRVLAYLYWKNGQTHFAIQLLKDLNQKFPNDTSTQKLLDHLLSHPSST